MIRDFRKLILYGRTIKKKKNQLHCGRGFLESSGPAMSWRTCWAPTCIPMGGYLCRGLTPYCSHRKRRQRQNPCQTGAASTEEGYAGQGCHAEERLVHSTPPTAQARVNFLWLLAWKITETAWRILGALGSAWSFQHLSII